MGRQPDTTCNAWSLPRERVRALITNLHGYDDWTEHRVVCRSLFLQSKRLDSVAEHRVRCRHGSTRSRRSFREFPRRQRHNSGSLERRGLGLGLRSSGFRYEQFGTLHRLVRNGDERWAIRAHRQSNNNWLSIRQARSIVLAQGRKLHGGFWGSL